MTAITFHVPGAPVGKARPRATTVAGRARMYTPAKSVSYEGLVAMQAQLAMEGRQLLEGPVRLHLLVGLPVPASWSKKKQAAALARQVLPTKKPDWDNVAKAICDGMNGVVWRDDVQACSATVDKVYSATPGVTVTATPMEGAAA